MPGGVGNHSRVGIKHASNMDNMNLAMLQMVKTKEERLNVMERMSSKLMELGTYIEPEEEVPLMMPPTDSSWASRVDKIQATRQLGMSWVERYSHRIEDQKMKIIDMKDGKVVAAPKTEEEKREQKALRTAFMKRVIRQPPVPHRPQDVMDTDLQPFVKQTQQDASRSSMCCKCWLAAGPGPKRLDCRYCGAFCHASCANDEEGEIPRRFGLTTTKVSSSSSVLPLRDEDSHDSYICPFCIDSLNADTKYRQNGYERNLHKYKVIVAVIRMQAAIRSASTGRWFTRVVFAAKLLQRVVRARQLWKRTEMVKKSLKRPMRLRLHDIDMMIKQALPSALAKVTPIAKLPAESHRVGDMPVSTYETMFGPNGTLDTVDSHNRDTLDMVNLLKLDHQTAPAYVDPCSAAKRPKGELFLTVSIHEAAEGGYGKQEYRIDVPLTPDNEPSRIYMRRGRAGSPQLQKNGAHESLSPELITGIAEGFRVRNYSVYGNKNYILIPWVTAEVTLRLTFSEVTDWPKAVVKGQVEMNIFKNLLWKRAGSFTTDLRNPVAWQDLPGSSDGSVVSLQLPRNEPPSPAMTFPSIEETQKKAAAAAAEAEAITAGATGGGGGGGGGGGRRRGELQSGGLPAVGSPAAAGVGGGVHGRGKRSSIAMGASNAAELAKVLIAQQMAAAQKVKDDAEAKVKAEHDALTTAKAKEKLPNLKKEINKDLKTYPWTSVAGGFLTWTVLPISEASGNHYGQLISHTSASLDSGRRRVWFVLIDQHIYVYNAKSIKPKYFFPMAVCAVTAVAGEMGMMVLKNPAETLYLCAETPPEGRVWFEKLYSQSASDAKKPYASLKPYPFGLNYPMGEVGPMVEATGETSEERKGELAGSMLALSMVK